MDVPALSAWQEKSEQLPVADKSERGQEYVDGLKGIITRNLLDVADDAVFRDGPTKYLVGSMNEEAATKLRGPL